MTASPPTRLTPLLEPARAAGARFAERDGWQIAESFAGTDAETAAVRRAVGLADATPNGKILIEGGAAESLLAAVLAAPALAIGAGAAVGGAWVYRLRPDQFFLSTPPASETALVDRLRTQRGDRFVTVTDLTAARAELLVLGPAAPALLSQLCGLDFGRFPDGAARPSSVAKTAQLLIRRDRGGLPAWAVIGARSLGAYLWSAVLEAGRDRGIVPVGDAAVRALEAQR
jgi:heterotetrameric sarcosine oxidase gamma subunit